MRLRLPSPALAFASVALVVASTGSAIAAKHYLISSTSQISPKVIKQLHGARGARGLTGPAGASGATGAVGATGAAGVAGADGRNGADLVSRLPLVAGQSMSGLFAASGVVTTGGSLAALIPFPQPIAAALDTAHVIETSSPPIAHCAGQGFSDPGYLCLYRTASANVTFSFPIDPSTVTIGAGRLGTLLGYGESGTPGASTYVYGVWTYTAA